MFKNIIFIDRNSTETIQTQIRRQMAIAILAKQFPIHRPLPSIRKLAKDVGVSIMTVTLAYDNLKVDGFIKAKAGSGFYVNPKIFSDEIDEKNGSENNKIFHSKERQYDFKSLFAGRSFDLERVVKPADALVRYRYPFICGLVDPSLFPITSWRECVRDSVNVVELANWAADFSTTDDPQLVEALMHHCIFPRGIKAHPDEILITVGGQMALYLAIKALHEKGGYLGVEDPGYPDVTNMAKIEGINTVPLSVDREGLELGQIPENLTSLYVTPSHQFPTNATMPLKNRKQLLKETKEKNILIIEDDYEADISFNKVPPPALKSLDNFDNIIYIGSLTKNLLPGLRIGYVVANKELIKEFRALRHHIMRHPPVNNQRTVALFLQRGYFDRHVTKLKNNYKNRCNVMHRELEHYFPGRAIKPNFGGGSIWFHLPEGVDSHDLLQKVKEKSIIFETVGNSFSNTSLNRDYIRIGFSLIDVGDIPKGIQLLAEAIMEMS